MLRIAIDGACRRNGKPDCVSSSGVFIKDGESFQAISSYEFHSTNQRGELHALIYALTYVSEVDCETQIITDSEYLFNAMTKQWPQRWLANGWKTASGEPVKNKDLWWRVVDTMSKIKSEVHFYHIKGHCISFGKVTASGLLNEDTNGSKLYYSVCRKYEESKLSKAENLEAAQVLSEKNNGFRLDDNILKEFVVFNTVVDAIATDAVEVADMIH